MVDHFVDYFEVFNIPQSYDVDLSLLTKNYRSLAQTVHPDRFSNAPKADQDYATARSAELNDAREMLVNPVTRAEYLMKIHGFLPWGVDSETQTETDPDFLYKQIEYRERLDEFKTNEQELKQLLGEVSADFHNTKNRFREHFPNGNRDFLRKVLIEMQFLQKLQKVIEELL